MRQFEMGEISIMGVTPKNSYAESTMEVEFACGNSVHKVKAFVAEEGVYKARFLPEKSGRWTYRAYGDANEQGEFEVEPAKPSSHGKLEAKDCHFEYQDGKNCFIFGTTVYAFIHQNQEIYEETMNTLEQGVFNKIRFCVFPKHYDFNHNEPDFYAFEKDKNGKWDVNRPGFSFWNRLDNTILRLNEMGIECDLILFHPYDRWGFSKFSEKEDLIYLDYLLRRLSAMPNIWWSIANEYDFVSSKDITHWEHIEEYISENDPYHHLLGNHNGIKFWDHTRKNITHASLQTKMLTRICEWRKKYQKPICIDECCYEGNIIHSWGSISAKEMTYRFWRVVTTGGYCTHGETYYNDQDILWWSKGGKLVGESPARIAFLRDLVEKFPGPIDPSPGIFERILFSDEKEIEKEKEKQKSNPGYSHFIDAITRLEEEERLAYISTDPIYSGHVGEDVYLIFYDLRCCLKSEIELPEDKDYKLELIDVWNMTRETIAEKVRGKVEYAMPGKEGYAILATKIN